MGGERRGREGKRRRGKERPELLHSLTYVQINGLCCFKIILGKVGINEGND